SFRIAAMAAVFGLSLLASVLAVDGFAAAGFYLLPTRAWELMLGAALALGVVPRLPGRRLNACVAFLGTAMILIAALAYDSSVPFPGVAALLPCLGAALVIRAGGDHGFARVLGWKPLVLIGLISYSLYLWHWPILVFLRLGFGTVELPAEVAAGAILASFLAAYLSWRWVEQPFRRKGRISRRRIFSLSLAGAALCTLLASAVIAADGLPRRLPDELHVLQTAESDSERYRKSCMNRLPKDGLCRIGVEQVTGTVLLWGDSHASTLMWALDSVASKAGRSGYLASQIACPPLLGVRRDDWSWPACVAFNNTYIELIEAGNSGIDTVVLSARWALTATGERATGEAGEDIRLVEMNGASGPGTAALFLRGLENLVDRLRRAGVAVVLLGGVPEIGWDVPATLALRAKLALPLPEAPNLSEIEARNAEANDVLYRLAEAEGVDFVRIAPLLCRPTCQVLEGNRPLYVDDDHLSAFGSGEVLGPELIGLILQ
ncbi:MAG: acyltransferase family protein, partial [Rhodovibrionaceae bacterium]